MDLNARFLSLYPRYTWWIYSSIVLLLAGIYFGSLAELMLEVDDARTFRDNVAVAQDFTYLFSSNKEVGSGRLMADFVRFLAYLLVGNQPGPVHLFVVAVHTLASLLLARLAFRLGMPLNVSLLSGLLFLVNVAQFRAIHWIAALDYPLALVWSFLTLLAYLHYRDQPHLLRLALFYLCLLLSLLTHLVTALVLPFFVYLLWRQGRPLRACLRHFAGPVALSPLVLYGVLSSTSKASTTWWAIERYATEGMELLLGCGRMLLWLLGRMVTTAYWLPLPLYEQQEWELYIGAGLLILLLGVIWKRIYPLDAWALWVLMALAPFALLTEGTVNALLAGPSRYLYLATGGWAVMLGWTLIELGQWLGQRLGIKNNYVLAGLLVPILVSSYVSLKNIEALSFYISSRYYTAEESKEEGIAQMRRALAHAPEMLPLEDAYARFISQLFATGEDTQAVVEEALAICPDSGIFLTYSYILESIQPDSVSRARGQQKLDAARKNMPREKLKDYIELIAMSYHNIGVGLYNKKDIEGAIQAYYKALEVAPGRLNTLKELATASSVLQRLEETQSLLPSDSHVDTDAPSALYLNALRTASEGRIDEAIKLCQQALDLKPSGEIFHLLSHCYAEKDQLDDALEALHQAMHLMGDQVSYRTYFQLGTLYYRTGQFEQAVAAYRQSIRLDSQDFEPYADLGTALMELGRLEEAEQAYRQALAIHGHHPKLHYSLGRLKLQQGDRQEATKAFEAAVQKGSDDIHAYWTLGRLYWQADQHQQALEVFRQLVQLDLQGDSEIYAQVGVLFNERGEVDHAIQAYGKALALDSSNAEVRVNLGWLYYTRGKFEAAIAAYRQVVDQQPHSIAQFSLGLAYLHQGQIEAARAAYARGIEQFGRAEAEKAGAVKDLQNLIARGFHATEAKEILDTYWHE